MDKYNTIQYNAHLVTNETSVWFGWFYPTDVKDQMVVSEHDDTTDILRRTRSCTKNELTTITTTWNQYYRALYVLQRTIFITEDYMMIYCTTSREAAD